MKKPFIESFAFSDSRNRIRREGDEASGRWWTGDVVTRYGIVAIYADDTHTRLDYAANGRHYMQTAERGERAPRGLAIDATKFAAACQKRHGRDGE